MSPIGKKQKTTDEQARLQIERLETLFPDCVSETADAKGRVTKTVDFPRLQALLTGADDDDEPYAFTWTGKREAAAAAVRPARKILRPVPADSVDWEGTQNLYIEGDNLDALKLLRETRAGTVKVIYIDPPYNTGNDYVYRDRPARGAGPGRSHSDWCSMIYPRLILGRELLREDGVIFISIDDHEQANLKKICDEVFGEGNFLAQIVWERAFSPVNLKKHFSESHDYILCYAKSKPDAVCRGLPRSERANRRYANPDNDPRGPWTSGDLSVGPRVESRVYEIVTPGGRRILPPSGYCWRLDQAAFEAYVRDGRIWFGDGNTVPRIKRFLSEVKQGITPMTVWKHGEVGHSQDATKGLKALFDGKAYFEYPKPVELIERCIRLYSDPDSTVMDFFSGSATTAHAVMRLNAADGGNRRFIMVQLPEPCRKNSAAFRDGYATICEIGKERIRRAGRQIRAALPPDAAAPDLGFRVYALEDADGTAD